MRVVLGRLAEEKILCKVQEVRVLVGNTPFLGHVVSKEEILVILSRTKTVSPEKQSLTVTKARGFLSLAK